MDFIQALSIRRKLLLLGVLVLLAVSVPLVFQWRQSQELVGAAQGEINGISPARQLVRLVQLTQQHRGLSAGMLGGKAEMQAPRDAKKAEVDKALADLDKQLPEAGFSAKLLSAWKEGTDAWRALEADVSAKRLPAADSSTRHAQLIARYFKVLDVLLDDSGLILDPQADTYYLMTASLIKLPFATEALGQTRARGAGFLAEAKIGPEGKVLLSGVIQLAEDHYSTMVTAFDKSFAANPAIQQALAEKVGALKTQVQATLDLARRELLQPETPSYSPVDYVSTFTKTIDALFVVDGVALDLLNSQLEERVNGLQRGNLIQAALAGGLLLIIGLLVQLLSRSMTVPLQRAVGLAERIAEGDLSGDVQASGRDEIGQLMRALATMKSGLARMVGQVRGNADSVATAAREIAQGNADLSQRTEQQAASLQRTASSMEQLTATVSANAENARMANQQAQSACSVAERGGEVVGQVVHTMHGIEASSRKVGDIIGVIDDIAFQTNILALNAAVEAARAGEQGRGFAVVAGEVRALAQRSAEAAKEIKTLIGASVEQVEAGGKLVETAGTTMQQASIAIRQVAETIAQISEASSQQSHGLAQINDAVVQMDHLTQQNAALVEQAAAAGASLQDQASRLLELMRAFRLGGADAASSGPAESGGNAAAALPAERVRLHAAA
ncbi:methyl-accepting chemotaxis protein [Ideonella sp.]|uniref:methyl-accepting chemotaxis protein n=1 Tax=Ideonella sp. TaxID=1929293 RepID=UPI0035B3E172